MADAVEALGQHMHQEPADELMRGQCHGGVSARPLHPVILDREGHAAGVGADQAAVGDGDAVGVSGEIGQHRLWAGERRLGIDHPFGAALPLDEGGEGARGSQPLQRAEEGKPALGVSGGQHREEQAAEQSRQHPDGQEEAWPAGHPARAVG
jgi:hypothetical protein